MCFCAAARVVAQSSLPPKRSNGPSRSCRALAGPKPTLALRRPPVTAKAASAKTVAGRWPRSHLSAIASNTDFEIFAALSALLGRSLLARRKQLSGSVPSQKKKGDSPVPRRILKHKTSIPYWTAPPVAQRQQDKSTRPDTQDNKPCHEWKERAAAPRAAASLAC